MADFTVHRSNESVRNPIIETISGFQMDQYESEDGQRILKGLCDEIFGRLMKEKIYACAKIKEGIWRRSWVMCIPKLGTVSLFWEEVEDYGKEWLKEKDEKFRRALRELSYVSRDNIEVDDDVISETSFGDVWVIDENTEV